MTKLQYAHPGKLGGADAEWVEADWILGMYLPSQLTTLDTALVQMASVEDIHHVTLGSDQKSSERRTDSKGSTGSIQGKGNIQQQYQEDAVIHTGLLHTTQVMNQE